jgi:hypothetical protein
MEPFHLLHGRIAFCLGLDVVASTLHPRRTTGNLVALDPPCKDDECPRREVVHEESAGNGLEQSPSERLSLGLMRRPRTRAADSDSRRLRGGRLPAGPFSAMSRHQAGERGSASDERGHHSCLVGKERLISTPRTGSLLRRFRVLSRKRTRTTVCGVTSVLSGSSADPTMCRTHPCLFETRSPRAPSFSPYGSVETSRQLRRTRASSSSTGLSGSATSPGRCGTNISN